MTRETREEAVKTLIDMANVLCLDPNTPQGIAFKMAIKALSQQTEDAISRQAALDAFGLSEKTRKYGGDQSGYDTMMLYEIQRTLEDLPSVTPKQRTGHWILTIEDWNKWTCSECGFSERTDIHVTLGYNYCPKCGAKMEAHDDD